MASLTIFASIASGKECGLGTSSLSRGPSHSGTSSYHPRFGRNADNQDLTEFIHQESLECAAAPITLESVTEDDSTSRTKIEPLVTPKTSKAPDFNQEIYYKNKLEFSLEAGWLPINIPLPFDVFSGDAYNTYPLKYTLVPISASLRWHMNGIGGPWVLRGNWDFQFIGAVTAIPRGPESRYLAYMMGMRRNFIPRNWRATPYFDVRVGVGNVDAKGPIGVYYAQGQNLTFNFNFGSGVRYNLNPRTAISAGVNYMHISNGNLSQGWGVTNYGINVVGPMVGIDVQLRKHRR